jgi:hypothetical protein
MFESQFNLLINLWLTVLAQQSDLVFSLGLT